MNCAGSQMQGVKLFQVLDASQTDLIEGALSIKSVQHNAFQEIAQIQIVVVSKGPEHFQEALFHADAGLHSFHRVFDHAISPIWYQITTVPKQRASRN